MQRTAPNINLYQVTVWFSRDLQQESAVSGHASGVMTDLEHMSSVVLIY